jgi:putative SOS response-associated peptidase YedK
MFLPSFKPPGSDRATLDRAAEDLCREFDLAGGAQGSWGNWSQLHDLRPGHPAFVLRRTGADQRLGLDTQRWDIRGSDGGGGEGGLPTTRLMGVAQPWWLRLAMRPAQRCLIPVTACTVPLPLRDGRDRERGSGWNGRSAWFSLVDEPVFTIAGLWRDTGDARCFAMLGCPADAPLSVQPVVIAPADRARWLDADWDAAAPLLAPVAAERIRIGLPETLLSEAGPALYAQNGHDRPWHPAATLPSGTVSGR